jgi:hypothetical protein
LMFSMVARIAFGRLNSAKTSCTRHSLSIFNVNTAHWHRSWLVCLDTIHIALQSKTHGESRSTFPAVLVKNVQFHAPRAPTRTGNVLSITTTVVRICVDHKYLVKTTQASLCRALRATLTERTCRSFAIRLSTGS